MAGFVPDDMPERRYGVLSTSPMAMAHDVLIAYRKGEHTVLRHEQARCELLALIDGERFTMKAYLLWCQRLNDVDNGNPITGSFRGSPDYRPGAWE